MFDYGAPDDGEVWPLRDALGDPVEIAVEVQLEHVGRIVVRPPRRLRPRSHEASPAKIQIVDKGVNESDQVVHRHIVLDPCRQQQHLMPSMTFDVGHVRRLHRDI